MLFSTVAVTAFAALAAAAPVKRGFSGQATYYATGLGACGQVSSDSDFIVALNSPQYGSGYPGPNCFKQIQISANGKTATATIMDQCPGCAYGDLDMSPSLFQHFAEEAVGRFEMSWDFAGAAPQPTYEAPKTSSTPAPTPTSTWVAPTSTWVAPTTTSETPSSTWVAPSSSSTPQVSSSSVAPSSSAAPVAQSSSVQAVSAVVSSSASSALASSSAVSTTATSTASAPIPTITVDFGSGNLAQLCEAVAQMGKLVVVGASLANGTAVSLGNTTLNFE